ncbi:rhodanese-like domain-containing protein [Oceanobacillus sp. CAU 1775]
MTTIQWILLILIIAFFIYRLMPAKGIMNISVQDAKNKFKDKNVEFIDVRTPGEYKANHKKPFKNIPLFELASKIDKFDKEKEFVLVCQSGMRSSKAARILKKNGFEKIYNVKGGMGAWF